MSFYDAIRVGASGAADAYEVERSLRFNSSDTTYLTRTPSSTGNQKVWTWSSWIKRTTLGSSSQYLFVSNEANSSGHGIAGLYFQNDQLYTYYDTSSGQTYGAVNSRKYRDIGAWYHIVWQVDAANTTHKIWINGVEETSLSNNPINYNYTMNQSGHANVIGTSPWNTSSAPSNMYLAEVHFSDGTKYAASDFGETDATTGQWVPKSVNITYGTNGFYLNFSDNSGTSATTLGKDSSGNGNNWTPNNFSVSAGAGNDSVIDTPTNNFPVWNSLYASPLQTGGPTVYTYGNLRLATNTGYPTAGQFYPFGFASFGARSGKWYAEIKNVNAGGAIGIANNGQLDSDVTNNPYGAFASTSFIYTNTGEIRTNNGDLSGQASYGAGDIIGIAMDLDNMKLYFHKNGSYINSGNPSTGSNGYTIGALPSDRSGEYIFSAGSNGSSNGLFDINLGQIKTAGTSYADSEGIGSFDYAVPTGFKALCLKNLPDPTILLPNKHFNTLLYSGDGGGSSDSGTQSLTGLAFQPDWSWLKVRSTGFHHRLFDAVRGVGKNLRSDNTGAEETSDQGVTAFNSDGITVKQGDIEYNATGETYVAWNWNAGDTDGTTYRVVVVSDSGNKYRFRNSANSATFAQSAVTLDLAEGGTYIFNMDDSTNASHPFSIGTAANGTVYTSGITYFLDGVSKTYSQYTSGFSSATTRRLHITVPASAPQLYYWCSAHSGMGGAINTNSTLGSSNFDGTIQSVTKVNATAGFSIVTYTGTGSSTTVGHGLGVKPDAIIIKCRSNTDNWMVYHNRKNNGVDPEDYYLELNSTSAGPNSTAMLNDTAPTSTVVTIGSDNSVNGSGRTYVMYCFSAVSSYSKFGSYTGNGSTDGTFIFLGFRPAWFLLKRSDTSANYLLYDNKRDPDNRVAQGLFPNTSGAETEQTGGFVDFVSNGVKLKEDGSAMNASGGTYIYFCFAEAPFKNARAR